MKAIEIGQASATAHARELEDDIDNLKRRLAVLANRMLLADRQVNVLGGSRSNGG